MSDNIFDRLASTPNTFDALSGSTPTTVEQGRDFLQTGNQAVSAMPGATLGAVPDLVAAPVAPGPGATRLQVVSHKIARHQYERSREAFGQTIDQLQLAARSAAARADVDNPDNVSAFPDQPKPGAAPLPGPDTVDAGTDPAATQPPVASSVTAPMGPRDYLNPGDYAAGALASGVRTVGDVPRGLAAASDAMTDLLGHMAAKVGAKGAFDVLMAPARYLGINDKARAISSRADAAMDPLDIPAEFREGMDAKVSANIGALGGILLTGWMGGRGAQGTTLIAQGFDAMAQRVKAKGGQNTVGGDLATLGGGAAMGLLENANVRQLLEWTPPQFRSAVADGIIRVASKVGKGAAIGAAIQLNNNIAIKVGVDPTQALTEGVGESAAIMGITDLLMYPAVGGRAGQPGKDVGTPGAAGGGDTGGPGARFGGGGGTAPDTSTLLADANGNVLTWSTHKQAAMYAAKNELGGSHERVMMPDGRIALQQRQPSTPGVRQTAAEAAAQPTPGDIASPLPTEDIVAGRAAMARDAAAPKANAILSGAGIPPVGTKVDVTINGRTVSGTVDDAYEVQVQGVGVSQGVKLKMDDGTEFEQPFDVLRDMGARITPRAAAAPDDTTSTTLKSGEDSGSPPPIGTTPDQVAPVDVEDMVAKARQWASSQYGAGTPQAVDYEQGYVAGAQGQPLDGGASRHVAKGHRMGRGHAGGDALVERMVPITLGRESGGHDYGADGKLLTSPKGAEGRMQVMGPTQTDPGYGVTPARDHSPEELARVGRDYLAAMMKRYGDPAKAWAAYNGGPGRLDDAMRAGGDDWLAHMPKETRDYVAANMARLRGGGADLPPTAADTSAPTASVDTPSSPATDSSPASPLDTLKTKLASGEPLLPTDLGPGAAAAPASIAGQPSDKEWTPFPASSGTLGIPRADMPQIQAEHRGAMVNFLNARGISHEEQTVPASSLKPTQAEFSPAKVAKARDYEGGDRAILTSADGHVLDGHHQWIANAHQNVRTIRLNAPIRDLIQHAHEFPSSTTSGGGAAKQVISESAIAAEREPEVADRMREINAAATPETVARMHDAPVDSPATRLLGHAREAMGLSDSDVAEIMARARVIAALAKRDSVGRVHVAEALSYSDKRTPQSAAPSSQPRGTAVDALKKKLTEKRGGDLSARPDLGPTMGDPSDPAASLGAVWEGRGVALPEGARRWLLREGHAVARGSGKNLVLTSKGEAELRRLDEESGRAAADRERGDEPRGRPGAVVTVADMAKAHDERVAASTAPVKEVEDKRLTTTERSALERLLVSTAKGGEGYHRDSVGAHQARKIIEAGETASPAEERFLESALRAADRATGKERTPADIGAEAYARAEPRVPPRALAPGDQREWLAGWDRANLADDPAKTAAAGISAPPRDNFAGDSKTAAAEPPAEPEQPKARAKGYGDNNKFVKPGRAEEIRRKLREKLNQLNAGVDPETLALGIELGMFHAEAGIRKFADFVKAVADDLGATPSKLKPYLRGWYNGARDTLEDHGEDVSDMDGPGAVRAALSMIPDSDKELGQETSHGPLPNDHASRAAGPGAEAVSASPQDGSARSLPDSQSQRGGEAVRRPDQRAPDHPERSGAGSAGEGAGDRGGDVANARRPGERRAAGADRNYVIAPGGLEESRGPKQKARDNLFAIELIRQLERDGRLATPAEQEGLAKYVGWGGLKGAFADPTTGDYAKGFEEIGRRLKEVLTPEEYETARRSIQYAHYTAEKIVREMWRAVEQQGFTGGLVFEPGMGTGNFAGMMPDTVRGATRYVGIEMDGITASIAKALYPKHGIQQADFTQYPLTQDTYDLVIGNPPFSETVIKSDPAYKRHSFVLHDYFFAKSLDMVRPGGLLAFVTSAGTMNKLDTGAREYLADRANLVGAIRLPGDAFEENAGTKVTTDIVFLRKLLPGEEASGRGWVETGEFTAPNKAGEQTTGAVSRYFLDHPEQVLGRQGFFDPLYPNRYAVKAEPGESFEKKLAAAIDRLGEGSMVDEAGARAADNASVDFASSEKKTGTFYIGDGGELYQHFGSVGRMVETRKKGEKGGIAVDDQQKIRALIPIRDALRTVYAHDLAGRAKEGDAARGELNRHYDAFVAKHGPINKKIISFRRPSRVQVESAWRKAREEARERGFEWEDGTFDPTTLYDAGASVAEVARAREEMKEAIEAAGETWDNGTFNPEEVPDTVIEKMPNVHAFMDDPESFRLLSIEEYNDTTGEAKKGPAFFHNIVSRQTTPEITSAQDALYHVLNMQGRVDLEQIARVARLSPAQVIEDLTGQIYRDPATGGWEVAAKYLSGNIREKLTAAEAKAGADPAYRPNVDALRGVLPADLGATDVRATLGMHWIDPADVEAFAKDALGLTQFTARYQAGLASWTTAGDRASAAATQDWGTSRRSASELISDALNGKSPKIYDTHRDANGNTVSVLNQQETQAANDKLVAIKDRFKAWVWEDEERKARLLRVYNDLYNSHVAPAYDGAHLTTPGVSAHWTWRDHQRRGIARIVMDGNVYLAHAVGAGKTSTMIGGAMEMKRLGLVSKPMFVVPNHMLVQFTKEFYELYPTARIMVADEDRSFVKDRRKQFVSDMATSDLDAVIIKHSAFGLLPLSIEFQKRHVQEHLDELRAMLSEMKTDKGGDNRITRRKVEQQIEQAEQRMLAVTTRRVDQTFTFEETGVDFLFVDEAHLFRKLDFATSRGDIKGIDPQGSMRSMDLFMKTRYLEGKRPNRSHVLASGTPITNTMAELYTVSRYLQPSELRRRGIDRFDAWAGAFGDTVTELEPTAAGTYKPQTRFSQFVNVPELSVMVRQAMDVVTPEQLSQYVVRPTARRHLEVVPQTPGQAAYQATLAARMKALEERKGPPKKGDDIILKVIGDGRKSAIDMRLVEPSHPAEETKLTRLIDNTARIWKETKNTPFHGVSNGAYTPKPVMYGPATQMVFASLGVGANMKFNVHRFIAEELVRRGVPRSEIVLFNGLKNDVAKQRVFNDMNEGKVRILVGSVDKMGTGVNAQRRLKAGHNLDPEWLPSSDEQRNGRTIRQGNMNPEVDIYNYSTKGTYDSAMWGMMGRKAKFIEGFFRGDPTLRDMEDLGEASTYEQAKALTTKDPRILELTEAKQELERELRRRSAHDSAIADAGRRARQARAWSSTLTAALVHEKADVAQAEDIRGDAFKATIGKASFDDRKAFQTALETAMAADNRRRGIHVIGKLGGFDLALTSSLGFTVVDGHKTEHLSSTPVLLLNGEKHDEPRYKDLSRDNAAASAQAFIARLPAIAEGTQREIENFKKEAAEFQGRYDAAAAYPGEKKIAELEDKVDRINAELSAEGQQTEAKVAGGAKVDVPAPDDTPDDPTPPGVAAPRARYYMGGDGADRQSDPLRGDGNPLPARRGGSVRALGVADDIRREGTAALLGREVAAPADLAELAQVYRDPRYETLRVFFMKGDKIVHATGVSARLPGSAPLLPNGMSEVNYVGWLKEQMVAAGADGFYMLHNHPSGEPSPSRADVRITAMIAHGMGDAFRGHVIINSNRYGVIDPDGNVGVHDRDFGPEKLLQPSKPHPILGQQINAFSKLAEAAKALQRPGFVTLIGADSNLKVRAVVDYPESELERPPVILLGALRKLQRQAGATALFLVGSREALNRQPVMDAIRKNVLIEAIDENGASSRSQHPYQQSAESPLEKPNASFVAEDRVEFDGSTEERWQEASKGIQTTGDGFITRVKLGLQRVGHLATRHWEHLPNVPKYSDLQQKLRQVESAPTAARERAVHMLTQMVQGFTRADLDLFTRKVVLDDLAFEVDQEHDLPFGFTPETLRAAKAEVDAAVAARPDLEQAVRRRKAVNREIARDLVAAGVLDEERVRNPAYYRHMVLDYARAERAAAAANPKLRSPRWARREGSSLDINANLLEAEFDWLAKALVDIPVAKTIDWIGESEHNILPGLRDQAKQTNADAIGERLREDLARNGPEGELVVQDQQFRRNIAMGFKFIEDALETAHLDVPERLQGSLEAVMGGGGDPFPFLSWLLDNNLPGANGAAVVLKNLSMRRLWHKELLGKAYLDPMDARQLVDRLAPEGYAPWSPDESMLLFTVKTVPEHAMDELMRRIDAAPGQSPEAVRAFAEQTRQMLAFGGERFTMALPQEVADTLNQLRRPDIDGFVSEIAKGLQRRWKQWVLINPRRVIKYNLNNLSGDLDAIIAGNPKSLRNVGRAAIEVAKVMRGAAEPSERYLEAVERGVFDSGLSIQEIPDINSLSRFAALADGVSMRPDKVMKRALGKVWQALQGTTQWRENVLRYAAYLDYAARIEAGEPMNKIGYGASLPKMVDAVTDPRDRAALLARDLVGDYGNVSVMGQWLRKYLIPFWSWKEINTRRYWRLSRNAFYESPTRGFATAGALGAAAGARTGLWLAMRMGLLYALISLWNMLAHPDAEKELDDEQRRQLHVILGHDPSGQVVTLRLQGALSDALAWFGLGDAAHAIHDWEKGSGDWFDVLKAAPKATVNQLASSTNPFLQEMYEAGSGRKIFPDVFARRFIRDQWRNVFQTWSLENEYDLLMHKPSRGYGASWIDSTVYRRDPGEIAYNTAKTLAYDWLDKKKGSTEFASTTPRANALYDFRAAKRFEDPDAERAAVEKMVDLGMTMKDVKTSVKRADPLGPIPKKYRKEFVASLTPEQVETFRKAEDFYQQRFLQGPAE